MAPSHVPRFFPPASLERLRSLVDIDPDLVVTDFAEPRAAAALAQAEVLVTGWGCPRFGPRELDAAPRLRAVVHTAGTVKPHLTEECWHRGVAVSSAAAANALPVAEYTLAAILLANKRVLTTRDLYRERRGGPVDWHATLAGHGNYRRVIGVVGASRIGRRVIELLAPFDFEVLVSDPHLSPADAAALGVTPVELDELCATSDVVSLHAPALPSTRHLIDRRRLALMRDGATFINTARGWLVDHDALLDELASGRLHAVIDVTEPEVLPADSPLYELPNVLLTPHVAGSMGGELRRMADFALDELERWVRGEPFAEPVLLEHLARSA
ncbi:hydroxyacid dehydrogenase [Allostreptomyces psammosilenae]|nr:hydroxyacid dehydrogenase [Allostreptomyces psammosilenae]